jgi:hypothetical protein
MAQRFERLMQEQAARDELLSAYLDDQLDAGDRARLEARLAVDPALRSELEMLRRTVALVRDLPSQPVPRNFILPQETASGVRRAPRQQLVRATRTRWLAPFLTAATTVIGLLFVAVLAGDLLFSGVGGMTQLAAPVPAAERESAPAEEAAGDEQEAPQMLAITESPEKEAGAEAPPGGGEGEYLATPPPAAAALPTASEEAEKVGGPMPASEETPLAAAGGGGGPTVESPAPTPTPVAEAADAAAQTGTSEAERAAPVPPPGPATAEPTQQILRDTAPAPNEVGETEPPSGDRGPSEQGRGEEFFFYVTPRRVAEVALGGFALLLLAATIWAWRARRH